MTRQTDAGPLAHAPFGEDIRLRRRGLEHGPTELFKEMPAADLEPADRSFLVEPREQLADRRIQLGEVIACRRPRESGAL